ncbi:MAG: hypothetical protein DRP08_05190 [Candidatus Aenigmatarchaeota archaeon]|nr:MAG: hypothetical protein DRP08_05190 [Candidatus Aenigmarchaeota archaeon]
MKTLKEIAKLIVKSGKCCRYCGYRFTTDDIRCYPHKGGIEVKGYEGRQWVYMHCRKCGYDWALWKLIGGEGE